MAAGELTCRRSTSYWHLVHGKVGFFPAFLALVSDIVATCREIVLLNDHTNIRIMNMKIMFPVHEFKILSIHGLVFFWGGLYFCYM